MDEVKRKRLEYRRKWKSATKSLVSMRSDTENNPNSNDCTHNVGFQSNDSGEGQRMNEVPKSWSTNIDVDKSHDCDDDGNGDIWDLIDQNGHTTFSSDSDSELENEAVTCTSLTDDLAAWTNQFQVKHNAVDHLLKLLQHHGLPNMPATARTLLKTVRSVETGTKSGMEYIYFGLEDEILKNFRNYPLEAKVNVNILDILLNIDGLPLFRSRKKSLWPVLCAIQLEPVKIFPIALPFGETKPTDLEFLHDTIRDMDQLLQHGLQCDDKIIQVRLRCIVCDAPERAMVKNIKQYSGYYGCERCTQKGEWLGRLTYQDVDNVVLRTDLSFRNQAQEEHHHGLSPFCNLPIDMVKQFSIDYMHQACLGVMKRLFLIWLRGKKEVKLSAGHVEEVSRRLVELWRCIPACFARKPRNLDEIDRWKATEHRQFLLYSGKLVLKDILRPDLFEHFLTLSVAMSILVCPRLANLHREYADELLKYFVVQGRNLYGQEFLVYNVHCLIHLASDVEVYGSLDKCSAFPFENYLYQLKRMVRSGKKPLSQIVKRLGELDNFDTIHGQSRTTVSAQRPDNAYIISSYSCCEVVDVTNEEDERHNKKLLCRVYERSQPLFLQPCDSRTIEIHQVNARHAHMKILSERCLERKAIMVNREHGTKIFLAILHEF